MDKKQRPSNGRLKNDESIINAFAIAARARRGFCTPAGSCNASVSLRAVMCPRRVCVCLLIQASASAQLGISEAVIFTEGETNKENNGAGQHAGCLHEKTLSMIFMLKQAQYLK